MGIRLTCALVFAAVATAPAAAHADVQHTIARGHTLQAIANRYRVSVKSIIEANKLKEQDLKRLRVGDVLTIPNVQPSPKSKTDKAKADKAEKTDKAKDKTKKAGADADKKKRPEPVTFAQKPKTPGVVHVKRIATTEEQDIRIADKSGRVSAATLKTFEKMLRSAGGLSHPIDARLVSLLGAVSNHFGSRKIEVVSGFRPYTPTQSTQHSNHNHGKAIDFRVIGVPNDVVRDFCRTLKKVGCGYYPHGSFVHMDVRDASAFWIDYSKPGEAPRYNAPNVEADEGTSDVHDELHLQPAVTPAEPAEPDAEPTPTTPAEPLPEPESP